MKKILNLENINNLTNNELNHLNNVLRKINFFKEIQEKVHPKHKHVKEEYMVLRKSQNKKDVLNGQNYIREDYINTEGDIVYARIYNFNGEIISSCG